MLERRMESPGALRRLLAVQVYDGVATFKLASLLRTKPARTPTSVLVRLRTRELEDEKCVKQSRGTSLPLPQSFSGLSQSATPERRSRSRGPSRPRASTPAVKASAITTTRLATKATPSTARANRWTSSTLTTLRVAPTS